MCVVMNGAKHTEKKGRSEEMKTLSWGIEIELVSISKATAARAVQSVVGGTIEHGMNGACQVIASDGRTWNLVHDGSLSGPSTQNAEVVSPILKFEDIEMLQEVIRALRRAGAKVDSSTSAHVHLSHPDLNPKTIRNLVRIVHKHETMIQHILQVSDARKNRYCKTMDEGVVKRFEKKITTERELNEAWYGYYNPRPQRYDLQRYNGLNLTSYLIRRTVEFRWAAPKKLHAGEIKAVIIFVLALCARALKVKNCSSKKKEFNPTTTRYDGRILLLALGLSGDTHKNTRKHLMSHLEGCSAWKHGRPDRRQQAA
jgi:hypothetical protein